MSSHNHRSPILMEQSISPPHLLSPQLNPIPTTIVQAATSESVEQLSANTHERPEDEPNPDTPAMDAPPQSPSAPSTSSVVEAPASATLPPAIPEIENVNIETIAEGGQTSPNASEDGMQQTNNQDAAVLDTTVDAHPAEETVMNGTGAESPTETATEGATQVENEATTSTQEDETNPDAPAVAQDTTPEAEPEAEAEPADNTPPWVLYEEDTSTPDEEEMKDIIDADLDRLDAGDIRAMENHLFTDLDDSEQRPNKKMRLSWVIKGVRGTREKPNMAKVMNSPAVCIDGLYWSIKFYPRGDNCASLSAFVRCSRAPPKQLEEMPEHEFAFFEGIPEADFGKDYQPIVRVSAPNTLKVRAPPKPSKKSQAATEETKISNTNVDAESSGDQPWTADDDDANDANDDLENSDMKDWRVSAQLGMAIYNPAETKTNQCQSDGHQYTKHCDDWGWVNFVGPWDKIHKRKRGDRKPLLQDDTLAIDAYIRIFDDPTEALWWHDSKAENQWPSKELAGFYPMGTPALFHAPAVAGITAWAVLAPFRKIIQAHDGYTWRKKSSVMPTPLICQTQLVLQLMRNLVGDCYVSVNKIIEELTEVSESWEDVKSFWQVYRRGLELELKDNEQALKAFSDIFDAGGQRFEMPSIPVPGSKDVASGLSKHFTDSNYRGPLPNFLPVMLNRQHFDKVKREWKLHQDRIQLTDELDLSAWSTQDAAQYVLYGFVVHVGARSSGKFYSILRPGGIGTKWLAFEDGNGNKVFSYTKKRVQEFEGLEGEELEKLDGEREKVYMAMYVRKSCWDDYLPREMESYNLPSWLRPWIDGRVNVSDDLLKEELEKTEALEQSQKEKGVEVELYLDEFVAGRTDMLTLHDLRCSSDALVCKQLVMIAMDKTFTDLKTKIAEALEISDVEKVAFWEIGYRDVGRYCRAELEAMELRKKICSQTHPGEIFRMWLTILPHDGRKDSYKEMLPKIAEMGLEIMSPTPDPPIDPVESYTVEAEQSTSTAEQPTPTAQQSGEETSQIATDTSSSHTEDSTTTGVATPATGDTADSAVDAEQESVAAAVVADVSQASSAAPNAANPPQAAQTVEEVGDETSGSDSTTPVPAEVDDHASVNPVPDQPLEHGHLVEAVADSVVVPEDASAIPGDNMEAHGPTPDDEISAEDAAAIAALLAADAAETAAEIAAQDESSIDPPVPNGVDQETDQSPVPATEVVEARAPTPEPPHIYGFLYTFDADEQRFIAQMPFSPVVGKEIGPSISKALKFPEDNEFRIWRREGPSGTSPITSSTSYFDEKFEDGFVLIVGDILSEVKIDLLKQQGKFWQPSQLIKHQIMTRRRHPILSVTSETPVEIAEFGSDYFKGPVVNGQPHGEKCLLITATGHTYEGPLIAGVKSGANGKMTYQNGDAYTGDWLNDERHGQGEHIEARTGNRYVGGFENGKRWGEGTTYWKVADEQADMCQICYGEEIDALFFDCGHVCACMECAERQLNNGCPICRKPVRQVVKMYRA